MTTYRAAVWTSDDGQAETVLTSQEQAHLSDDDLIAAAELERLEIGLTPEQESDGEITIQMWSD